MQQQRDLAIQLTNVANFYQLGILGGTANALSLSSHPSYRRDGDKLNIVVGYNIAGLALATVLEGHGFWRPGTAEPNVLASAFGNNSSGPTLSPLMLRYLNTPDPRSNNKHIEKERTDQILERSKSMRINPKDEKTVEKLSAEGQAHHKLDETIKMLNSRVSMLFDLRAMMRSSSVGFDQLIQSIN